MISWMVNSCVVVAGVPTASGGLSDVHEAACGGSDLDYWPRLGSYVISSVCQSVSLSVTKVLILPAIRFF